MVPKIKGNTKLFQSVNDGKGEKIAALRAIIFFINVSRRREARFGLEVSFSKADAALFDLPANLVIADARSVSRIEGIARTHDRAVKRLISYMAKNPSNPHPILHCTGSACLGCGGGGSSSGFIGESDAAAGS